MGGLKALIGRMFNAIIESTSVVVSVYPLGAAGTEQSQGQAIASAAAANDWGVWTPIIAAGVITTEYWYLGVQLHSVGVAGENGGVQIGHTDGTGPPPTLIRRVDEVEWCKFTAAAVDLVAPTIVTLPIKIIASAELSGRAATLNAASKNVTVSVKVATGL